jgi:predicted transcriptional regulator
MRHRGERGDALQRLFCHNIRQFRANLGLSQEELAEKAGVSVPFMGAVERGETGNLSTLMNETVNLLNTVTRDKKNED